MGHTWVDVVISDMEKKKSVKQKALVDTSATLTALPEKIANELGIKPIMEEEVMTGAGIVKVKRGRAWIKLEDKESLFDVWISDFIDKILLGVIVLETFGFEVDPATGKLKRRPLLLY